MMIRVAAVWLACASSVIPAFAADPAFAVVRVVPEELTNAVLHNPDMGWVLYENYALDQNPHGASTLREMPGENFSGVDAVALMFSWEDVEQQPGRYDFSKADFAYDYWAKRGKEMQLRMSATTLMWWARKSPATGRGAPAYVRERMARNEKQTRYLAGTSYDVEDARNPYYRARLTKFLRAVNRHFSGDRPVTLIDLRGFGVWGEWHSGFQYPTWEERRKALRGIIEMWSGAFPGHRLALSGSYDPDGPQDLYAGPNLNFDAKFTANHDEYLKFSGFDYALTKSNLTWRRDGCGGAVHSNERKLNEDAFRLGRGPMFSEFVSGYGESKKGDRNWVRRMVKDALSLHPNYVNLLGWQAQDARDFLQERPDLIENGLRKMGYRLVPISVRYLGSAVSGTPFRVEMQWVNRGVGRALRDYELQLSLLAPDGQVRAMTHPTKLETSRWVAGETYAVTLEAIFKGATPGKYQLAISLRDDKTGRRIALPLRESEAGQAYPIGNLTVITAER